MPTCSIIIPVYNRASITRHCLNALFARPPAVDFEVIVVDDGSRDVTPQVLAEYGSRIQVVTHPANLGFAMACNDGAAIARGTYLVFLNNDTLPQPGWLDVLVRHAEAHLKVGVVGSKLLYPDDTIQHAGVAIVQNGLPVHLYAGFPADHPAVNSSRRMVAVTGACMLVRRAAFAEVRGFDTAYYNFFEDVDLCLRLAEHGYETHYCHESVLTHLQSQSRDESWPREDPFGDAQHAVGLFQKRWGATMRQDDVTYYAKDGLLQFQPHHPYPLKLSVSPLLAVTDADERDRTSAGLLSIRTRQAYDVLQEKTRLESRLRDLELHLLTQGTVASVGTDTGAGSYRSWPALRAEASLFDVRNFVAGLYLQGEGIEIGALHSPLKVSEAATVRYVDRLTVADLRRQYPELDALPLVEPDIIDDGERLGSIEDASQDFVIGNHFLEHCEDPVGAVKTILRVLKPGGVAYMAIPDKRFTFDHRRPITTLDHLVRDHEDGPAWSRRDHFDEWVALAEDTSTRDMTVEQLLDIDYSIHFHVWTQFDLVEFFAYIAKRYQLPFTVELMTLNIVEVIFLLRKDA